MKQETSGKSGSEERSSSSGERTLKRYELASRRQQEQQHHQQHQSQQQQQQQQPQHKVGQKSSQQHGSTQQQAPKPVHRRQESDSKLGNASAFARAFRRENSDFFPSTRHSAYLQKSEPRSSIFASGNRRGSEISVAGIVGKKGSSIMSGEPILTDFSFGREGGPQRPRREKTESEIVFGNRHQDVASRDRAKARRLDNEARLSRDNDSGEARRRRFRPSEATSSDDAGTIKSTASTTASEYSPVVTQVSPAETPTACLPAGSNQNLRNELLSQRTMPTMILVPHSPDRPFCRFASLEQTSLFIPYGALDFFRFISYIYIFYWNFLWILVCKNWK